jgi:hypothetical protein
MRSIVSALRNQRKPNPIPVLPTGNRAGALLQRKIVLILLGLREIHWAESRI